MVLMQATSSQLFPTNFESFIEWFSTEEACVDFLARIRWSGNPVCPKCQNEKFWRTERGLYHCRTCSHQVSVTAGTVFEDTRKPLRVWFHVMWMMMAQKTGISANNMCDVYGFGSYQTAWGWLQKLRSVMVCAGREQLSGCVEVDEAYVGGQKQGARGRGAEGKTLVFVGVEVGSQRLGRVRFRCAASADGAGAEAFVRDYVAQGSRVVTDAYPIYNGLRAAGYAHEPHARQSAKEAGEEMLRHVHLVVSLLKRWLGGTYQGAVTPGHLQGYLNEFAFRFNRRLSTHRGKLFYRLMQQAVSARPKPIKQLYVGHTLHIAST
jgi:transposase-like protein